MKTRLLLFSYILSLGFSFGAFAAQQITVTGSAAESGYCRGDNAPNRCINEVKLRAESRARGQAELSCRTRNGNILGYTEYCSSFCSPSNLDPGFNALVSCNANCRYTCEIP